MDKELTQQSKEIKELEAKLKGIDQLAGNQVFKDEVKKIQEYYLQQLIQVRAQTAVAIQKACEIAASGGSGSAAVVPKKDYDELLEENKKLKYRQIHLLRALEENDAGAGASAKGQSGSKNESGAKIYVSEDGSSSYQMNMIQVLTQILGNNYTFELLDSDTINSKDFKAKNPTGMLPMLETADGNISGAFAICKHLCRTSGKLYLSGNALDCALVDQWVNWAFSNMMPNLEQVMNGVFGHPETPIYESDWKEASKVLKGHVKLVDNALIKGNGWLAGGQMTLADVIISVALTQAFQTVLDGGYQKAVKEVTKWASQLYASPQFMSVQGAITMCAKPLKPVVMPDAKDEVKKETKKEAKKETPAPKPEKPEKVLDNVQSLPPTSFDLFNFKTFFVNHADKKGAAVDEFYNKLDWDGWSFWHFRYDILPDEGKKQHVTNNLLTGFLSRAQHTSKYTFGRMAVLGEEPSLQIQGCWLLRGQVVPDGLAKEHSQFEYYIVRKMDPRNNQDDDKIVRSYFGGAVGDTIEGLKAQTIVWQK